MVEKGRGSKERNRGNVSCILKRDLKFVWGVSDQFNSCPARLLDVDVIALALVWNLPISPNVSSVFISRQERCEAAGCGRVRRGVTPLPHTCPRKHIAAESMVSCILLQEGRPTRAPFSRNGSCSRPFSLPIVPRIQTTRTNKRWSSGVRKK